MRSPGHGPGYRFHPTDVELTMYYLKKKVMRRKFYHDGIQERDVYNLDPRDLKAQEQWMGDLKWYFFCPRERKYSMGKRTNRSTGLGFWKTTGNDRSVNYKGKIVGMIKSLIFHEKNSKQRTDWVMHEYKLQDEYLRQLGWKEDEFVLCVIFEKEGPGPRNGAQYGAPFREEDWDDVDEEPNICEENTQGVGALSQVHDPTDKGKRTVLNEFGSADRCVGSSSRTFPSYTDQINHGFPPTPVLRTQLVDAQLPLTDEGGISLNEIPLVSLGHEPGLDIGVDQGVSPELTIPASKENIYDDLEDLIRMEKFLDFGVNACDNDPFANQKIPHDDFMEVADFQDGSDSIEGSFVHDHAGPKQPTCFGSVIPDDIHNLPFIGRQNLGDGVSDIAPSWNRHHHEPALIDHFIDGTQTDSRWFISGNFPNSSSLALHGSFQDQNSRVSEDSSGFNCQGSGGYEPVREYHPFSDGLCIKDFGDDVSYVNQHNQLAAGPLGFNGQGFGENLLHLSPRLQFAEGTDGFISQSSTENVTPLHGPQFAEDSAWRVPGSVQNVEYLNQRPQTADGSIWLHGQESSMNGQMDHGFAGNGAAAPFGNVQPPQSIPRGSTHDPS